MTIPNYQILMLPLLKIASDGKEHFLRDAVVQLSDEFNLTQEERSETLPSGQQTYIRNRVAWARTYLKKAGLLETTRRGYFKITKRGREVLKSKPEYLDNNYLNKYSEFNEFQTRKPNSCNESTTIIINNSDLETPEESIEKAYSTIRQQLSDELLKQVKSGTPSFFEKLVIDLLVKMGYGGTRKDAGKAVGKVNDGGIDGIIKEDRLGLDVIYIQAKKWEGTVGRPEIQKFAGALQGQRAKKGIFLTTGCFSEDAKKYVKSIESKIILIDGQLLSQYMIDFNVGVSLGSLYEIKRIDNDYFDEN
ncbi:MAG: restriction endonuclease [Proteobacteria bacterium]|nr:restriction endonuclease [Pseudomonadota bacterium]